MSPRPYIFYKRSELDALKITFEERAANWVQQWFAMESALSVNNITPFKGSAYVAGRQTRTLQVILPEAARLIINCDDKCVAHLAACLLNKKRKAPLLKPRYAKIGRLEERMVHNALENLAMDLLASKTENGHGVSEVIPELPADVGDGAGNLLLSMAVGQHELDVIMPPEVAEEVVGRDYKDGSKSSLYNDDIKGLLKTGSVRCEISLGTANISFSELLSLQVGDVIKLNGGLNEPCSLKFVGSANTVNCILGKKDCNKAVKII